MSQYCTGCGAPITWVITKAYKKMPCNPKLVHYVPGQGNEKFVTPEGETVSGRLAMACVDGAILGYTPHWATCPKAKAFKKEKPPAATGGHEERNRNDK